MAKSVYQILLQLEGDQKVKSALTSVGTQIGLTGAALTAFSAGVGKLAADYETSLSNIATVSSEATGSTEEFSNALYDLQQDMNGALNIQEAATASYDILSAGIKDQASVMQALESSQKAAIAGQSNLTAVSKAAVSVVNSYGESLGEGTTQAQKFDKVINLMLQTQLDGVITADEYAASIGRVAASWKTAGISIEEGNALIALTTAKGIPAASSFTNLSQAIANIQVPTTAATEEAKLLGIEFNATRLKAVGLAQIAEDIATSENFNANTLSNLFGSQEAKNSMSVLVDNFKEIDGAIQNQITGLDALSGAYAQFEDDANQRVTNAINQMQGAFIKLGEGVLIAVEPLITLLGGLAQTISELDPNILKVVGGLTAIAGITLTVAGGISLLVVALGSIVTNYAVLAGAIGAATVAMKAYAATMVMTGGSMSTFQASLILMSKGLAQIGPAIKGVMTSLYAMAPMLSVVAASAGAVYVAYQTWSGIVGPAREVDQVTREVVDGLNEYLKIRDELTTEDELVNHLEKVEDGLNGVQKISDKVITFIQRLQDAYNNLTPDLLKVVVGMTPLGTALGVIPRLSTNAEAAANRLSEAFNGLYESTSETSFEAAKLIDELENGGNVDPAAIKALTDNLDLAIQSLEGSTVTTEADISARDGMIETLESQKAALNGLTSVTEDSSSATGDNTEEIKDNEDAIKEAAKAYDDYAKRVQSAVGRLQTSADMQKDSLVGSASYVATESLRIQEQSTQDQIALLEDLKNQSGTSAEERLNIETEIQRKQHELNKNRIEANKQLEELYNQFLRDSANLRLTELEQRQLAENQTFLDTYNERKQIILDQAQIERDILNEKLANVTQGSAEEKALTLELAQLNLSTTQTLRELDNQATQERLSNIQAIIDKQREGLDLENQAFEIRQLQNEIEGQYLDSYGNILGKLSGLLNDDNVTLGQRAELLSLAEEITGKTFQSNNASSALDQARLAVQNELNSLELKKLDLKIRQLEIDKESLRIANEIKQLEISGQRQQIQEQLKDTSLNQQQKENLQRQDRALANQSNLENQRTSLQTEGIDNQIDFAGLERRLAEIMSRNTNAVGYGKQDNGNRYNVGRMERFAEAGNFSRSELDNLRQDGLISTEDYERIANAQNKYQKELADAQEKRDKEQTKKTSESAEATKTNAEVTRAGLEEVATDTKAINQVAGSIGELVNISSSILGVNRGMAERLNQISRQLDTLPAAIASRLPRPAPSAPSRK